MQWAYCGIRKARDDTVNLVGARRHGVIFVFTSLFPTLFLLIVVVVVINYGLECFTNLGIAYIHYSAHTLFVYNLVLVFLKLGV